MKKKNFKGLTLKKQVISNLLQRKVVGGESTGIPCVNYTTPDGGCPPPPPPPSMTYCGDIPCMKATGQYCENN